MKYFITMAESCPEFCCQTRVLCVGESYEGENGEEIFYLHSYPDLGIENLGDWMNSLSLICIFNCTAFNDQMEEVEPRFLAELISDSNIVHTNTLPETNNPRTNGPNT